MIQAVRALIINQYNQLYLVVHNYHRPENLGKWATPGGRMEEEDKSEIACLNRELTEEFGVEILSKIEIVKKISIFDRMVEGWTQPSVRHHFFYVKFSGIELVPNAPDEIIEGKFFSWEEIQDLKFRNKLFFGFEDVYFLRIMEDLIAPQRINS